MKSKMPFALFVVLALSACQKETTQPVLKSTQSNEISSQSVNFDESIHFPVLITGGAKTSFFCSFHTPAGTDTIFLREMVFIFSQRSDLAVLTKARLFINQNMIGAHPLTNSDTVIFAWAKAIAIPYSEFESWMYLNIVGSGPTNSSYKIDLVRAKFYQQEAAPERVLQTINLPQPGYKMIYK